MTDTTSDPHRQLLEDFDLCTARINAHPFNMTCWLGRSKFFRESSFLRLAIADAYKAFTLIPEPPLKGVKGVKGAKGDQTHNKHRAAEALVTCLYDIGVSKDAIPFEEHCSTDFKESTAFEDLKKKAKDMAEGPRIVRERYPWVPERSSSILEHVQVDFMNNGLEMRESTLAKGKLNNIGIFATQTFEAGEVIYKELCPGTDHDAFFTSQISRLAQVPSRVPEPDGWPWDRILALEPGECPKYLAKKRSVDPSPLTDEGDYSTMTTNYKIASRPFSFQHNIVQLVELMNLKQPWHPNHDYWVILEVQWRIENTRCRDEYTDGSLFSYCPKYASFFNHSCSPNVKWTMIPALNDRAHVTAVAMSDIAEGEELFVQYIPDTELDVVTRRKQLQLWLGEGVLCQCGKCKVDAGEVAAGELDQERGS